jgi:hypothetical protein
MEFVELMLVVTFAAICAVDELSFGHLLIGAIVARIAAQPLAGRATPHFASTAAGLVALVCLVRRAMHDRDDLSVVVLLVRTLLIYHFAWSGFTIGSVVYATICSWIAHFSRDAWSILRFIATVALLILFRVARLRLWRRRPAPARPLPTRRMRMERYAAAAQVEYEAEADLIQSLPLDEDEREVLTMQAKQRLLVKLARLPEL